MLEPFKGLEDEELDLVCIVQLYLKEFSVNAITSFKDDPVSMFLDFFLMNKTS